MREDLVIENLCKSYGQRKIIDKFNLTVHRGEVFGLLRAKWCR